MKRYQESGQAIGEGSCLRSTPSWKKRSRRRRPGGPGLNPQEMKETVKEAVKEAVRERVEEMVNESLTES